MCIFVLSIGNKNAKAEYLNGTYIIIAKRFHGERNHS